MRGITLAWIAGLGILTWRTAQKYRRPPVPGRLLGASVVFVALALIAESDKARYPATLAAWGFDIAILLKLPPDWLTWQHEDIADALGGQSPRVPVDPHPHPHGKQPALCSTSLTWPPRSAL